MRTGWFSALALGVAMRMVLPSSPALAYAQVSDMYKFKDFVESEAFRAQVGQLVAALPAAVLTQCPALTLMREQVKPLKFVSLAADGRPLHGSWLYQLTAKGCGDDQLLNFFFEAKGDGTVSAVVGPPGTSESGWFFPYDDNLKAMAKATTLALATAARVAASKSYAACPAYFVKDTEFRGFGLGPSKVPDPGPTAYFRPWWEFWAVVGCGHRFEMPLEFAPGRQGIVVTQPEGTVIER